MKHDSLDLGVVERRKYSSDSFSFQEIRIYVQTYMHWYFTNVVPVYSVLH